MDGFHPLVTGTATQLVRVFEFFAEKKAAECHTTVPHAAARMSVARLRKKVNAEAKRQGQAPGFTIQPLLPLKIRRNDHHHSAVSYGKHTSRSLVAACSFVAFACTVNKRSSTQAIGHSLAIQRTWSQLQMGSSSARY